jgi:hypothetical protein
MKIDLTEQEIELVYKLLDKASTSGIETQRLVVRLADKLRDALMAAPARMAAPTKVPDAPVEGAIS